MQQLHGVDVAVHVVERCHAVARKMRQPALDHSEVSFKFGFAGMRIDLVTF